ncbi:hypothetical protein [Sandaracinus amylolyticus]|uniref:Uncharacterized protein n=1 Tax=Sandaracinus amylolyticus TaxID=927083 RepID=A0A0F6W1D4_9BACT|nr:hypothetical protein [Sandaracinus amylolyticus]AKF04930.1 hypothetical protein DB32_002079 [Sandaracinus amylolyticus]
MIELERDALDTPRFVASDRGGHYESWFQRANHPTRPLAFWIRSTILARRGAPPEQALGEVWAIVFDGERGRVVAVREEFTIASCRFAPRGLDVDLAGSHLDARAIEGGAKSASRSLRWSLRYASASSPLLLFPRALYDAPLPRAKVLTSAPFARFDGTIEVDGEPLAIDGWIGSHNHNWGSRHTDRYAWGQVAGFDAAPEVFLEVATARVAVGPVLAPPLTVAVLRLGDEEVRFDSVPRGLAARASFHPFEWRFDVRAKGARLHGRMEAPASTFVALPYGNPPGGTKTCLNSKLARCEIVLERDGRAPLTLRTAHRAAFEMLGDDPAPRGIAAL